MVQGHDLRGMHSAGCSLNIANALFVVVNMYSTGGREDMRARTSIDIVIVPLSTQHRRVAQHVEEATVGNHAVDRGPCRQQ